VPKPEGIRGADV